MGASHNLNSDSLTYARSQVARHVRLALAGRRGPEGQTLMAERSYAETHSPPRARPAPDNPTASDEFASARMLGLVLIAGIVFWGAVLGGALWLLVAR
jgi:hypothetical protein